jgi:hypothetical protein
VSGEIRARQTIQESKHLAKEKELDNEKWYRTIQQIAHPPLLKITYLSEEVLISTRKRIAPICSGLVCYKLTGVVKHRCLLSQPLPGQSIHFVHTIRHVHLLRVSLVGENLGMWFLLG